MPAGVRASERRFRGEPAVELSSGSTAAVFVPHLGMTGVSLRCGGAEHLALPGGLDALALGTHHRAAPARTMGEPALGRVNTAPPASPWTSTGRRLPVDDHGLPMHGFLVGRSGWSVDRLATRADTARLRASIVVDAPAFPFPHRIEVTATVRDAELRIDTTIVPTGRRAVPVAFGWHPYLRLPAAPRRRWRLRLPARRHRALDDRGIPTGEARPSRAEAAELGRPHVRRRLRARPRPPTRHRDRERPVGRAALRSRLSLRAGVGPAQAAVRRARADGRADERAGRRQHAGRASRRDLHRTLHPDTRPTRLRSTHVDAHRGLRDHRRHQDRGRRCPQRLDRLVVRAAHRLGRGVRRRCWANPKHGRWSSRRRATSPRSAASYAGDSLVLETEFETADGTVKVTDFMSPGVEHPTIFRIVEGLSGAVADALELIARFDYGSIVPWAQSTGDGLTLVAGNDALRFHSPVPLQGKRHHDRRPTSPSREGQRRGFSLAWYSALDDPPPPARRLGRAAADTEQYWAEWVGAVHLCRASGATTSCGRSSR